MSTQDQTTVNQGTGTDDRLRTTNIFDTAAKLPEISRFVEAIRAAGLQGTVQTADFKTLFAPTNDALEAAGLDASDSERLASVVGRHIVIGRQTSADLRLASSLRTVAGEPLKVHVENRLPQVGGANLVRMDVACVNGQIHIIDRLVA